MRPLIIHLIVGMYRCRYGEEDPLISFCPVGTFCLVARSLILVADGLIKPLANVLDCLPINVKVASIVEKGD